MASMRRPARAARRRCDILLQYVTFCDGFVTFSDARAAGGGHRAAGVACRYTLILGFVYIPLMYPVLFVTRKRQHAERKPNFAAMLGIEVSALFWFLSCRVIDYGSLPDALYIYIYLFFGGLKSVVVS